MSGAERGIPSSADIVVTGLGAVTAYGWGIEPLWDGLREGAGAIAPFSRFDATRHRTRLAAEVPPSPAGARYERRSSFADRFAVESVREALRMAGLEGAVSGPMTGVFFGSSTGGMLECERYYERLLHDPKHRARPGLLASQQLNGPGDAVAREIAAQGPSETFSSACASGAMAIGAALRALRRGEVELAVAGASDALCQLTYAGFNALRSVDERPSRPFRADRAGLSIGEGAGVLILETRARAVSRGARVLATLAGEAATCDAFHMTAPQPQGHGAARAMRLALEDAGATPAEVDFVNAHGTGTPLNDAAEAAALQAVFGDRVPAIPVTSTKASIGHLLGSAGAVEALVTVLCLIRREVHPMPPAGDPDAALGLDLVLGRPRPLRRAACALSTSLAFGGANAALVLRHAEAP